MRKKSLQERCRENLKNPPKPGDYYCNGCGAPMVRPPIAPLRASLGGKVFRFCDACYEDIREGRAVLGSDYV